MRADLQTFSDAAFGRGSPPNESAQGGLWTEAIGPYEELEEYEKAGDPHVKIEQTEAADKQYRKALVKCRSDSNLVDAARLLEEKLDSVDEAVDELSSGWPNARQAGQCLRRLLEMLGRLGRHELAAGRIAK